MKKTIAFFLAIILFGGILFPLNVIADSGISDETNILGFSSGFKYEKTGMNQAAVVHYNEEISGEVVIPETIIFNGKVYTVTEIRSHALMDALGVTELIIPDTVTFLGNQSLFLCANLEKLVIGSGLKDIDSWAFNGCVDLKNIVVSNDNPYYKSANENMILTKDGKTLFYAGAGIIGDVIIPDSVEVVASGVFWRDQGISPSTGAYVEAAGIDSIVLNEGLKEIQVNAFRGQSNIKKVVIPDSVEIIGDSVFEYCDSLETVVVGKSVKSMGTGSFTWTEIEEIYFRSTTPPENLDNAFAFGGSEENGYEMMVYVPRGSKEAYRQALGDSTVYKYIIEEYDSETIPGESEKIPSPKPIQNNNRRSYSNTTGSSERDHLTTVKNFETITITKAVALAKIADTNAKVTGSDTAKVMFKNVKDLDKTTINTILSITSDIPNTSIIADSLSSDGKVVEIRLTLDAKKIDFGLDQKLNLSVSINSTRTMALKNIFTNIFENNIEVISTGQKGTYNQPVQIAVRVNLNGMDTANLKFYSYNQEERTLTEIKNSKYKVGQDGYLYFITELAGDIVVSSDSLVKK